MEESVIKKKPGSKVRKVLQNICSFRFCSDRPPHLLELF
jgi:hypothetical protein